MKLSEVVWSKRSSNPDWTHAEFAGGDIPQGTYVRKNTNGFYRVFEPSKDGVDMRVLEFTCWLQDKTQVPYLP